MSVTTIFLVVFLVAMVAMHFGRHRHGAGGHDSHGGGDDSGGHDEGIGGPDRVGETDRPGAFPGIDDDEHKHADHGAA